MLKQHLFFLLLIISPFLLFSCKQPETVIVTEDPTSSPSGTQTEDTTAKPASFKQLNIAEYNPIPSLSPLFAENNSTLRTLQLVFEGLVRYNEQEAIVPAVAERWLVSPDSLTYRFSLRNDVYYHDSNAFNNGIGRKLTARDVKYTFERMASIHVPGHAARLFTEIRGLEPFYREQHNVLLPGERQLSGITGIAVPNDSTVTFTLEQKDPHFLEKLASPYAVIYPREAVTTGDPAAFKPVGTGPFRLSQKQGSDRYVFAKYQNYYRTDEPVLDRVDVLVVSNGSAPADILQQGDIHLIPQLDPALMGSALNEEGDLNTKLADRFNLVYPAGRTYYSLNYNPNSQLNREVIRSIVQRADVATLLAQVPDKVIEFDGAADDEPSTAITGIDTLNTTFVSDPFLKSFLRTLSDTLKQDGITLRMLDIRTPVRSTGLFTGTWIPLYPSDTPPPSQDTLTRFSVQHTVMYLESIKNLSFNAFPWWIDLRTASLPGIDNIGR